MQHHFVGAICEKWLGNKGTHTMPFNARTTTLCSQICAGAVKCTHRIGTECFLANSTHLARTSRSGFVLSGYSKASAILSGLWGLLKDTYQWPQIFPLLCNHRQT